MKYITGKLRPSIIITTFFIILMATVLMISLSAIATDWPMWRNHASNTGNSTESIILPLTLRWHTNEPEVEENGAVAANGIVYMSTEDGNLYAFNVSTGEIVSGFPTTTGISYGTPAVDSINKKVYALTRDSKLYAFNLDGTSAWTANVGYVGTNYYEGPVIDEGYVYIKAGFQLQKFNSTGLLQWSSSTSGENTQPSIMGDYVYVNSENGQIRKYNKATGVELIAGGYPIETSFSCSALTTVNNKIFLKADQLYAYNASDGNLIWSQEVGGDSTYYGSPAVSKGVVYVYGWDSKVYAFDENNGSLMNGFPSGALNPTGERNWGSPTIAGDKIFIGAGTTQKLMVLGTAESENAGEILEEHLTFSADPQGFDLCSPIISDGVVFAMLDGGGLYAFYGSGVNWTGGSIIIANGINFTESPAVLLTLDKGSNTLVTEMRISEDPLFLNASWEPYSETKEWVLSEGFDIKTIYVQFKDSIGQLSNVFNDQIEYKESCDLAPPITIKLVGDPHYGSYVTSETLFILNAFDNGTGVNYTRYRIGYKGIWTEWINYTIPFNLSGECTHIIEYYSVDNVGNKEGINSHIHYVDDTPPISWMELGEPHYGNFITSKTNITLHAIDPGPCSVSNQTPPIFYYSVDGGINWFSCMGWFLTLNLNCSCNFIWFCTDTLTSIDITSINLAALDIPYFNASFTVVPYLTPFLQLDGCSYLWGTGEMFVTLGSSFTLGEDNQNPFGESAGYRIIYRVWWEGNHTWTPWILGPWNSSVTFTLNEECKHYVEWYAIDTLGNNESEPNWENLHNQTLYVDDTPPSSLVDPINPSQPQVAPFNITVSGMDDGCLGGCGIREIALYYQYSLDNTSWSTWILYGNNKTQSPYKWLFTAPMGNGYYEFYSLGVDNLGNTEQPPEFCDTRCPIQVGITPVYIDPPTQTLLGGESFSVSIAIDPAEEIAGAQFNLSFDPMLLTANTVMEGDLFTGFTSSFNPGSIDNTNGTINGVSGVITVPGGSTLSSGTLAIIHFTAKTSNGTTPLNLSKVIVGNLTGVPLQVSITNGSVDIIVDTAPPQIEDVITNPIPQVPGGHVNISGVITDNIEIEEICITIFYPGCIKKEKISLKDNRLGDLYYYNQTFDVIGYYYYFIWACDTSGNQVFSSWRNFKILPSA